ncbi:hypothetical protein [Flavobacterium soyae]|uniref:hypothetical protein n=1 Tax=Flavobacterium soyae TaxID=2903098 RepID=UPI001E4D2CC4|nr:hypothetical protein [Flavobacterium soyae]MCD9574454.1 hypothetical protein [Flavobacterium soyae]
MGLFNYFNRNQPKINNSNENIETEPKQTYPEISEKIFIQTEKFPEGISKEHPVSQENGISLLFEFLEKNYESKGYDDALINPDNTHLEQNIEALKSDLERTIRKIKTYYQDFIREINFHIESRARIGMIDTVEELSVKKYTAEEHIGQILEIESDAKNNTGLGQGMLISYTRGFRNGLAAISNHSIMKKTF